MRKFAILVLVLSGPAMIPAPAAAQAGAANPDITVTGDSRMVCRRLTRTATRMGTGRICRTQRQWAHDSSSQAAATNNPNATVDGAADTLAVATEKVSTSCVGGMSGNTGGAGPY